MCMQMFGPPFGIPIDEETHKKFPENVKLAWEVFDAWWKKQDQEVDIKMSDMPKDIKEAFDLICATPIPGFEDEGYTGRYSCYVNAVLMQIEE